jgi:hypothetical protein
VDGTGSESSQLMGFGISGIEPSGSVTRELISYHCARNQVEVSWVVISCSVVVGYQISEVYATSIFRVK